MAKNPFVVVGWKKDAIFQDRDTREIVKYNQLCVDTGEKLHIYTIRQEQRDRLDLLAPGDVLDGIPYFVQDKYLIFL